MATGQTALKEASDPLREMWLETRCRVVQAHAKEQPVHCGNRCEEHGACNGIDDEDPEWRGGCAYPCCDFSEWFSAWRLQPLCEEGAKQCFNFSPKRWQAAEVDATWCSTRSLLMRLAACNQTLSEAEATNNAVAWAPVGAEVPCFFNEQRTDIKLSPGAEELPGIEQGLVTRSGVYVFFGSLLVCLSCSCGLGSCGMGLATVTLEHRKQERLQMGANPGRMGNLCAGDVRSGWRHPDDE